jgi:hypothetical protein
MDHRGTSIDFQQELTGTQKAMLTAAALYLSYRFFNRKKIEHSVLLKTVFN